jgi:hypothetical protein
MHSPFGVASTRAGVQRPSGFGNHTRALCVEEGRTRPVHALPRDTRHINPMKRLETAKSASSQGEALALDECDQTLIQTHLKDMKMEFSS